MCAVMMQFFAFNSGLSGLMGSDDTTSRAAPAMVPSFRAVARSSSTMSGPREAFTRNAEGFMVRRSGAFTMPSFSEVSAAFRLTTSARRNASSAGTKAKGS